MVQARYRFFCCFSIIFSTRPLKLSDMSEYRFPIKMPRKQKCRWTQNGFFPFQGLITDQNEQVILHKIIVRKKKGLKGFACCSSTYLIVILRHSTCVFFLTGVIPNERIHFGRLPTHDIENQTQTTGRSSVADLVRCKACGFITDRKNVKDVCPACGVPAKMFEPYTHPVSLKRRRLLDLHTHPVGVHFPQAFALTLLFLSLLAYFVPKAILPALGTTMQVLSILLPFSVVGAIATGLLDGKLRFRKVTTPLLRKKIFLSLIFFAIAVLLAVLAISGQHLIFPSQLLYTALAAVISLCGVLLGLIGGKLLDAKFPG
jgi:ribosomal protein L37E